MKIAVGSDHGGLELKKEVLRYLKDNGYEVEDFGTHTNESCDYPKYGVAVAEAVVAGTFEKGIIICGTGQGIALAANKVKGARAVVCSDTFSAEMTRAHNDANILSLGERVVGKGLALKIVETWLNTAFEGGRHATRVDLIKTTEDKNFK